MLPQGKKPLLLTQTQVNYYTYMANAGGEAISNKEYVQFHDALLDAEKKMKENVKKAISLFCAI